MKKYIGIFCFVFIFSCTSTKDYLQEPITQETPTKEALEIAILRGGQDIKNALRLVVARRDQEKAKNFIFDRLMTKDEEIQKTFSDQANMIALLQSFRLEPQKTILLFETMKASLNPRQRELAWGVATAFPSKEMGVHIEKHLSQALLYDDLDRELLPAMADALAQNYLVSSYSILKQGLLKIHDIAFVQAMIKLNPMAAERDFLDYLSFVPLEELRQLNLESSNIFVCMEILEFLHARNPLPTHPKYDYLFNFAISRNPSLSSLAIDILDKASVKHRAHLAQMLARAQSWVQLAYIEKVRRNSNIQTRLFLKELKDISSKSLVLKEIEEFLR